MKEEEQREEGNEEEAEEGEQLIYGSCECLFFELCHGVFEITRIHLPPPVNSFPD